jgi:hypothetical protein
MPPVESFGVRWDFPLMVRDDELELDEIAEPGASHEKKWSDDEFLATLDKKGARTGDWIVAAMRDLAMKESSFHNYRRAMQVAGLIEKRGNRWFRCEVQGAK